jgi:hypothetical protein
MPKLHVDALRFAALADFTVAGGALGFGEVTLQLQAPARPGRWRALYLDEEALDRLVTAGEVDADARCEQLLLVHADRELPATRDLGHLRALGRVAIEAARFTVVDASHAPALASVEGFDEHLDGVHGAIEGGWGVHVGLWGDGHATVWVEDSAAAGLALVELR